MPSIDDVTIVLNPKENYFVDIVQKAFETEGWLYSVHDIDSFSCFDETWFYFALDKESGKPVASLLLSKNYDHDGNNPIFMVAFYYVLQSWRGTGLGTKLFDKVMSHVDKDTNAILHGVPKMCPRYASKYGFSVIEPTANEYATIKAEDFVKENHSSDFVYKSVADVDFSSVAAFDKTICSRRREKYLHSWLTSPVATSKVAYDKNGGEVIGICCIHIPCGGNPIVGPLYAENKEIAKSLVLSCLEDIRSDYKTINFYYCPLNKDCRKMFHELSDGKYTTAPCAFFQATKKLVSFPINKVFTLIEGAFSPV